MTVAYADTSWLIDRRARGLLLGAPGSTPDGVDAIVTSEITQVEVGRVLRRDDATRDWTEQVSEALAGTELLAVTGAVIHLAAALPTRFLRSLDAIHLASALLVTSAVVLTLDRRLADACREFGLETT